MQISTHLTEKLSIDATLHLVCEGIRSALGFQKVTIELPDVETGRFRPRAAAGWRLTDAAVNVGASPVEFAGLLEPQFAIEGCFLRPVEEVHARVAQEHRTYSSVMNGRGPYAWDHHWLVVPLYDANGGMTGFIWADDPEDRLLPDRQLLQALRMFANQVTTALDFAIQLEALRDSNEARRTLINASPLAILVSGIDGVVQSWNPAAERLFGWGEHEVVGRQLPIIPPDASDRADFEDLRSRLRRGETLTIFRCGASAETDRYGMSGCPRSLCATELVR